MNEAEKEALGQRIAREFAEEDHAAILAELNNATTTFADEFLTRKRAEMGAGNSALMAEYKRRVEEIQQGDFRALNDLKREFRGKGLDIW
jgi:hypothetical protein